MHNILHAHTQDETEKVVENMGEMLLRGDNHLIYFFHLTSIALLVFVHSEKLQLTNVQSWKTLKDGKNQQKKGIKNYWTKRKLFLLSVSFVFCVWIDNSILQREWRKPRISSSSETSCSFFVVSCRTSNMCNLLRWSACPFYHVTNMRTWKHPITYHCHHNTYSPLVVIQ